MTLRDEIAALSRLPDSPLAKNPIRKAIRDFFCRRNRHTWYVDFTAPQWIVGKNHVRFCDNCNAREVVCDGCGFSEVIRA